MIFPLDLTEKTKLLAQELVDSSIKSRRVDCHTHVQGDIFNFTAEMAKDNLIGSQSAGLHKYPDDVIEKSIKSMIGAKGESVRNGLSAGLASCVSQGRLPMKVAKQYMNDVLYINPAMVHNIPLDDL